MGGRNLGHLPVAALAHRITYATQPLLASCGDLVPGRNVSSCPLIMAANSMPVSSVPLQGLLTSRTLKPHALTCRRPEEEHPRDAQQTAEDQAANEP